MTEKLTLQTTTATPDARRGVVLHRLLAWSLLQLLAVTRPIRMQIRRREKARGAEAIFSCCSGTNSTWVYRRPQNKKEEARIKQEAREKDANSSHQPIAQQVRMTLLNQNPLVLLVLQCMVSLPYHWCAKWKDENEKRKGVFYTGLSPPQNIIVETNSKRLVGLERGISSLKNDDLQIETTGNAEESVARVTHFGSLLVIANHGGTHAKSISCKDARKTIQMLASKMELAVPPTEHTTAS